MQVNDAGSDSGLRLELFLGDDATQSQYILNSGARVVIHDQSETPIIISEGTDVSTGFQTNIGVSKSYLSKLDSPYSDCIKNVKSPDSFDSDYYRAIFNILNMTTYRQKICTRICLQSYVKQKCTCLDGSLPNIYGSNETICATIEKLKCVSNARISYFSKEASQTCKECPLECDSTNFILSISNSRYPTRYYQHYMQAQTNVLDRLPPNFGSEITKTTVLVTVFYDDLATTNIKETPAVTPESLLGNIGGNLGLFIVSS